jgi:hypothetical protein
MPELGYAPVNHYLPPREPRQVAAYDRGPGLVQRVKDWVNQAVAR